MRNFKGTATAVFVVPQVNIDVFEDARLSNIDIRQDVASNSLHNTLVHTEYEQLRNWLPWKMKGYVLLAVSRAARKAF